MAPGRSMGSKSTAVEHTYSTSHDMAPQDSGPQRKKRRNTNGTPQAKPIRGRRGRLAKLPEMPLDILFEIFSHLDPLDVLNLSRTTKSFRTILMRRSGISIWKAAFSNLDGFPACPPDLTEAQYADLAFKKRCHFCSLANVQEPLWACRVRCCRNCQREQCIDYDQICRFFEPTDFRFPLSSEETSTVVSAVQNSRHTLPPDTWLRSDVDRLLQHILRLHDDGEALMAFFKQTKSMIAERRKHEVECHSYQKTMDEHRWEQRRNELEDARKRRKNAIFEKLTELGWGEEIGDIEEHFLSQHPLVNQAKDLTNRIWNKIMPTLIELLEAKKAEQLQLERKYVVRKRLTFVLGIVREYLRTRPTTEPFPGPGDYYCMEPFQRIVRSPSETNITKESFAALSEKLLELSDEWRQSRNRDLLAIMACGDVAEATSPQESLSDFSPLYLATTFFSVNCRCSQPISYPRILVHECLTSGQSYSLRDEQCEQSSAFAAIGKPWNYDRRDITFCRSASDLARAIVIVCGKNPNDTTSTDMDTFDPWLECQSCIASGKASSDCTFSWRQLILHSFDHGYGSEIAKASSELWKVVNDGDASAARKRAINALDSSLSSRENDCCVRCNMTVGRRALGQHLKYSHGIDRVVKAVDFVHHLDIPMTVYPFAGMSSLCRAS